MTSYQSAAGLSKRLRALVVAAALAGLGAAPYEDARRGFRLELPDGWALAPRFGETQAMVFTREVRTRRDRGLVSLTVRSEAGHPTFTAFVEAQERALSAQPGFARLGERRAPLGGSPALLREYRAELAPGEEKRLRAYFLPAPDRAYLALVEGRARDLERVDKELAVALASFRTLGVSAPPPPPPPRAEPGPGAVAGRWENDDGLVLVLGSDGGFVLGELTGRFELDDRTLTLVIPGQGREPFGYTLDATAGTLVLESSNLEAPMTYRRRGAGQAAPAPRAAAPAGGLAGDWRAGEAVVLRLGADGRFELGSHRGTWSAEGALLRLDRGGGEVISYRHRLEGAELVLEGADLDAPLRLTRR